MPRSSRSAIRHLTLAIILVVTSLLTAEPAPAAAGPLPNFATTTVFSGLRNPTAVEFASDGRIFVAEKSGLIKVFPELGATGTTFADLRTEVYNYWDRGLLGLALHPGFPTTPYVYALYTRDALPGGAAPHWNDRCPTPPGPNADGCPATARLVRLTASGNVATGTPLTLVADWCVQFPSHTIADLAFGPDGMLYASGGDGASFTGVDYGQLGGQVDGSPTPSNPCGDPPSPAGSQLTPPTAEGGALRSQDLRTTGDPTGLNGTVIRIDPTTGAGVAGNPLIGSADLNARRIIAHGLRNPFRFAFRPGTSELWVGDVGWSTHEEINRVTSIGAPVENFGWPCYEGPSRQGSYDNADLTICENLYAQAGAVTVPWFAYQHNQPAFSGDTCTPGSSSIAGMAFYAGGSYPDAYDGALFFADYSRACIWAALPPAPGGVPSPTALQTFVTAAGGVVELEIGPGGDLYYVDLGDPAGNQANGTIRRIHYAPGNQPPNAVATATPSAGPAPLSVTFSAASSTDPNPGDLLTFAWDLDDDGAFDDATGESASATFNTPGTHTVSVRATDSLGATDVDDVVVSVGNSPPVPVISTPAASTTWAVGQTINFSGSAGDGEGGALPASALTWTLVMHHCPSSCHQHPIETFDGVASGSFVTPDHEYPSHLELVLTAEDPQGLTASASVDLDPRTVTLTLASDPSGAQLSVGSVSKATPFTVVAIVGGSLSVSAPNQALGGAQLDFASWSDGGAQTHGITVPATNRTYTATFDVSVAMAPPRFDAGPEDLEAWEGITASFVIGASDPDGGPVTYSAAGLPSGFSIDANSGRIRGIRGYSGSGRFPITVTARDDEGTTSVRRVTLTVQDALFARRRASFGAGTHTGLAFAPDGTITATRVATLSRASGASVDRRRLWNGRPYLHVVNGIWAGYWVPESASIHLPGVVGRVTFTDDRRAAFLAGPHTGYRLSSGGALVSPRTYALVRNSGADASDRAVIAGLPYLRIVNGIWANHWVPEHLVAIAAGAHTAYAIEAGSVTSAFSYTLARNSGASAVIRSPAAGGAYLGIWNGVFADHWLRESSRARLRVDLGD